ncbi:hypothetical protein QFZ67_004598 [Streptomyces sp. V1I1]|jgi:hypothetical protein|nr:hypothetical protein [Streptomyces sp. V1I1]
MGDSLTLAILTISGVITVTLFVVKGILDQLPGVLDSWRRAARALREADLRDEGEDEEPPNRPG